MMDSFLQDTRAAFRVLRKTPALTAAILLTVALGVGANTAIFAVVYGALLRPLPYPAADRIVVAGDQAPGLFLDWRGSASAFTSMAALRVGSFDVTGFDRPERIDGAVVNGAFFDVMAMRAALGRSLMPADDGRGARVAVLANAYWRNRFGYGTNPIGRSLTLNGEPHTIVGVMPPAFDEPAGTQVWIAPRFPVPDHPLRPTVDPSADRGSHYLAVYARLRPDATLATAQVEQRTIFERVRQANPSSVLAEDVAFELVPLRQWLVGDIRPALLVLFAAVALVLLIGCANIANLMLAHSAARQQEIAVRAALGARRGRLARQLFTESLWLAILGGTLGVLTAVWTVPALRAVGPDDVQALRIVIDLPVLAFASVISLLTGLLFGCAPVFLAVSAPLADTLRSQGRGGDQGLGRRIRQSLVASELAVSVVLLVGAALMLRSFAALRHVDPGFRPDGLYTSRVDLPPDRYASSEQQARAFQALLDAVHGIPGMQDVSAAARLPFAQGNSTRGISIEGSSNDGSPWAGIRVIAPRYFEVMGIPLRSGRAFSGLDKAGAPPVAIVNEAMARRFWPGKSPLGRRFRIGTNGPSLEIVGVVGDVKHASLRDETIPEFYQPFMQAPWNFMTIVMKTALPPGAVATGLRDALAQVDPMLAEPPVRPMRDLLAVSLALDRFETLGLSMFAGVAVALAAIGLYGVLAYLVSRRTREIGVRIALGARSMDIIALVAGDALWPTSAGLTAGIAGALLATRVLRASLFGIAPNDLLTFVGVAALLVAVAGLATYLPARRAARTDAMVALRTE